MSSSGDIDDLEPLEDKQVNPSVQNVLYLIDDEDEQEDGEEMEPGQDVRKVTVSDLYSCVNHFYTSAL